MNLSLHEAAKRFVEQRWREVNAVQSLKINGISMGSAIPHGSTVRIRFSHRPRLRRGEVVYLRRGELRVAHRLVAALGPLCIEKGDANKYPRLCLRSDIIGTVVDVLSPEDTC